MVDTRPWEDEPRIPRGFPGGGRWTTGGWADQLLHGLRELAHPGPEPARLEPHRARFTRLGGGMVELQHPGQAEQGGFPGGGTGGLADRWLQGVRIMARGVGFGQTAEELAALSPDWTVHAHGLGPMAAMDAGSARAMGDWADQLIGRVGRHPDYTPGQWRQVPIREHMASRWALLVSAFEHDGMRHSEAVSTANQMFAEYVPPRRVYANGHHEVVIEDGTIGFDEQAVLRHIDGLMVDYPTTGPVRIAIIPYGNPATHGITRGGLTFRTDQEGVAPTATVYLSDWSMMGRVATRPMPALPAAQRSPVWQHILSHEWGHVQTLGGQYEGKIGGYTQAQMSEYGLSHHSEFVADAFSEWVQSGGQTQNPLVRQVAAFYHWKVPTWGR